MKLTEAMQEAKAIRDEISGIRARAASEGRECEAHERTIINTKAGRLMVLEDSIREAQNSPNNSLIRAIGGNFANLVSGGNPTDARSSNPVTLAASREPEYAQALHGYLKSGGKVASADLQAGADGLPSFCTVEAKAKASASRDVYGVYKRGQTQADQS